MIVFLFGLPGVGKTYIGQLMQKELGACFWDGDKALTNEMIEAVHNHQPFSHQMMTELIDTIIKQITELKETQKFIIVSQAMLRESDRKIFLEHFNDLHFIYIRCEPEEVTQRIEQRADFVTVSYCKQLMEVFEPHREVAESYPTIDNYNKTDEQLITEFTQLLDVTFKFNTKLNFFTQVPQSDSSMYCQTDLSTMSYEDSYSLFQ